MRFCEIKKRAKAFFQREYAEDWEDRYYTIGQLDEIINAPLPLHTPKV